MKQLNVKTAYENLANAIISQACKDYMDAIRDRKPTNTYENFFRSEWYKTLTSLDGEHLMDKCRSGAEKFISLAEENFKKGFVSQSHYPCDKAFVCPVCGGNVYIRRVTLFRDKKRKQITFGHRTICDRCNFKVKRATETKCYDKDCYVGKSF